MQSSKIFVFVLTTIISMILCSCQNWKRDAKKIWDSGPIENIHHGGSFVGYVNVYTIDWLEGTKSRSSNRYRVYKKNNGTYIIDYEGENYILYKADEPYGSGAYALKWQMDYNHYIEDIPTSF